MNYAALLALLSAIAFAFPFIVRIAERIGVPRSYSIVVSLALLIFGLAWLYIRWRMATPEPAEPTPSRLPHEPFEPNIFFQEDVFLGERLSQEGRYEEALRTYEAYRAILVMQKRDTDEVDKHILDLKQRIAI